MPMVTDRAEPEFWYFRAEEVRVKAELYLFPHPRALMLRIAEQYDRLGDQAAKRIADGLQDEERPKA
jgi:hypothetical protein